MSIYTSTLASYYDELMGDYGGIITTTKKLIKKYIKKKNTKLLELGCGTGNILKTLPSSLTLFGLDISEGMIQQAKKKIPQATYYVGDMSNFHLPEHFGMVICVFDSLNHLLTFSQWQRTFANVAKHLDSQGIFIVDINTPRRLESLSKSAAYVVKGKGKLFAIKCLKHEDNIYAARFQIFTNLTSQNPFLFEENIYEAVFPVMKVKKALEVHFEILDIIDPYRNRVGEEAGRLFFVCQKRSKK